MTPVSLAVTAAPAPVPRATAPSPGLALYVGLPDSEAVDATLLADLSQAVVGLVTELVPGAVTHSALATDPVERGTDLVDRLRDLVAAGTATRPGSATTPATATSQQDRPAAARAEQAWHGRAPAPHVVVDTDARRVTVAGRRIDLTFKELALLEYLLRAPHRAVSRDELLRTVWKRGVPIEGTRTIDVHVRRLRNKLGGLPQIVTVRGVGYRCDPTPETVLVGSGDAG